MDQINATMTENELINQTALEPDTGACPAGSETYRVQRGDIIYLEKLPLFNPDGTVLG